MALYRVEQPLIFGFFKHGDNEVVAKALRTDSHGFWSVELFPVDTSLRLGGVAALSACEFPEMVEATVSWINDTPGLHVPEHSLVLRSQMPNRLNEGLANMIVRRSA